MSLCRDPDHPARDPRTRVTRRLRYEVVCHGVDDDATAYDGIAPLKRDERVGPIEVGLAVLACRDIPEVAHVALLARRSPVRHPFRVEVPSRGIPVRRGAVAILMDVKAVSPGVSPSRSATTSMPFWTLVKVTIPMTLLPAVG